DLLIDIRRQDAQGDARVAVVEAAADPVAVAVVDLDNAATGQAAAGLLDHLLKDPRVRRAPLDLQPDRRPLAGGRGFHAGILRPPPCGTPVAIWDFNGFLKSCTRANHVRHTR